MRRYPRALVGGVAWIAAVLLAFFVPVIAPGVFFASAIMAVGVTAVEISREDVEHG